MSADKGEVIALRLNRVHYFQVVWEGCLCAPTWTERGPAVAYLDMLRRGQRKPEYSIREGAR